MYSSHCSINIQDYIQHCYLYNNTCTCNYLIYSPSKSSIITLAELNTITVKPLKEEEVTDNTRVKLSASSRATWFPLVANVIEKLCDVVDGVY